MHSFSAPRHLWVIGVALGIVALAAILLTLYLLDYYGKLPGRSTKTGPNETGRRQPKRWPGRKQKGETPESKQESANAEETKQEASKQEANNVKSETKQESSKQAANNVKSSKWLR